MCVSNFRKWVLPPLRDGAWTAGKLTSPGCSQRARLLPSQASGGPRGRLVACSFLPSLSPLLALWHSLLFGVPGASARRGSVDGGWSPALQSAVRFQANLVFSSVKWDRWGPPGGRSRNEVRAFYDCAPSRIAPGPTLALCPSFTSCLSLILLSLLEAFVTTGQQAAPSASICLC